MDWYQIITLIVIPILSVLGAGSLLQAVLDRRWKRKDKQEAEEKEKRLLEEKRNKEEEDETRKKEMREIFKEETQHIKESLDKQDEKIETLLQADKRHSASLISVLRDRLYQLNRYCYKKGYTTQEERNNFEEMYNSYRELGANGVMVNTHEKFMLLPSQEEYEFRKNIKD